MTNSGTYLYKAANAIRNFGIVPQSKLPLASNFKENNPEIKDDDGGKKKKEYIILRKEQDEEAKRVHSRTVRWILKPTVPPSNSNSR